MEGSHEIFIAAVFEGDTVVGTCVVHQSVDLSKFRHHFGDGPSALSRIGEFGRHLEAMRGVLFQCQQVICLTAADDHRDRALLCQGLHNACTYAFRATGHDDDFSIHSEFHQSML